MRKRIKKVLLSLMTLALVIGSANFQALTVQAAATTKYYTFNNVTEASAGSGSWGVTKTVSDAGALSASYSGEYAETQFALPEGVDASTLTNISFEVSTGDTSVFAIKVYKDGTQAAVKYGGTSLDVTADLSGAESVVIGLMSTSKEAASFVVDYFTVTAEQTGGSDTVPVLDPTTTPTTKYYTFNDIVAYGGYGYTAEVSDAGAVDLAFESQYMEARYTLPNGVDGNSLKNITFHLAEGAVSNLCIKIMADGNVVQTEYEVNTVNITADLSAAEEVTFALMNKGSAAADFVIDYFTVKALQTGGSAGVPTANSTDVVTTKYYTFNDVTKYEYYGCTDTVSSAGAVDLAFEGQYMEAKYTLPAGVNGNSLKSIKFDVTEGDLANLCIKIYADGTQAQAEYNKDTLIVTADLSEAETITFGLMDNGTAAADFHINYIQIKALQTGGSATAPEVEEDVLVTEITLSESSLSLETGATATLTATVAPDEATNKEITWASTNDEVATVDNTGKVTAVAEGTATITATATDGSDVSASCEVTVTQPVVVDPVEGFVTRMYQQCLDRDPDQSGLEGWVEQLESGQMNGAQIAEQFVFSAEMLEKNLSNEEFVNVLYRSMMGREADEVGMAGWLNELGNGYSTRSEVTKAFVESPEFTNICSEYGIERGEYDASMAPIEHFVERFYTLCLERDPDQKGMYGWVNNLKNKYMNGAQIADAFIFSDELVAKNVSNEKYVELLYNTLLGRPSDDNGKAGWLGELDNGYMTREGMMNAFIVSEEFTGICEEYGIERGTVE